MDLTVDGERWEDRGWDQLLMVMYDTDIVFELDYVRLPQDHPDGDGHTVVERIPNDSVAMEETDLSSEQVIFELRNLEKKGLVDFVKPFDDTDFVVARLTASGFDVAHDKYRMQRDEEWRRRSRSIDIMLTIATILLAVDATIQLTNRLSFDSAQSMPLVLTALAIVFIVLLIIRRRIRQSTF